MVRGNTISSSGSPWATLNPMTSSILISTCPAGSRPPLGSTLIIRSWEEVLSRANPWGSHRCQRTSANMNLFNPPSDPDLHYCSFSTDQETPRLKVQAIYLSNLYSEVNPKSVVYPYSFPYREGTQEPAPTRGTPLPPAPERNPPNAAERGSRVVGC